MRILHITPHMGGGVGTVIMGWMEADTDYRSYHAILCLDSINDKAQNALSRFNTPYIELGATSSYIPMYVDKADIILVHAWDHPWLEELLRKGLPDCRLVFWCHKNYPVPTKGVNYPDLFIDTSPIQGHGRHIWSTGNISRFLAIKPKAHEGFNIGYVGTVDYKKMHPDFFDMCLKITASIPGVRFTVVGENHLPHGPWDLMITYTGKVDDVAPYLAEMDVFGYPLRPDRYGTSEQVVGEAMAAGVVPVLMPNPAEKEIGFWVSSPQQYCDTIYFLHKHPDHRENLSICAREMARRKYSIDRMIASWNEVFAEMMEKPKRSHG